MPTKIEWCRNPDNSPGESWNPYHGCLRRCPYCYARAMAYRLKGRYGYPADDPFRPIFDESRLNQPYTWKKPRMVFVGSMGEFGYVSRANMLKVLKVVKENPRHRFLFLTQMTNQFVLNPYQWPDNAWVGISAPTSTRFYLAREALRSVEAPIRFVSFEPLLGGIAPDHESEHNINWIIIGRCTGPKGKRYPTRASWVVYLRNWAAIENIPVFMKDNLTPLVEEHPVLLPELRQEWPQP